jgi:hypothetical protein
MAVTVEITRRAVLRLPPPSARGGGRKSPLTAFDRASTDGYIPAIFAWNAPAPDNAVIVDGLLAAVARYPQLAGRFGIDDRGRKCFHLNDAGVLVVEAQADADLADALVHDVAAHIDELYPKADKVLYKGHTYVSIHTYKGAAVQGFVASVSHVSKDLRASFSLHASVKFCIS